MVWNWPVWVSNYPRSHPSITLIAPSNHGNITQGHQAITEGPRSTTLGTAWGKDPWTGSACAYLQLLWTFWLLCISWNVWIVLDYDELTPIVLVAMVTSPKGISACSGAQECCLRMFRWTINRIVLSYSKTLIISSCWSKTAVKQILFSLPMFLLTDPLSSGSVTGGTKLAKLHAFDRGQQSETFNSHYCISVWSKT